MLHQLELAADEAARSRVGAWAVAVLVTTLVGAGLKLACGPLLWRGCQPRVGASLLGMSRAELKDVQMPRHQGPQGNGGEARLDSADPRWREGVETGGMALVAGVASGTRDDRTVSGKHVEQTEGVMQLDWD